MRHGNGYYGSRRYDGFNGMTVSSPQLPAKPHPTQTPEYWERLATEERALAKSKRGDRWSTVESIKIHEQNAADYEATARGLRAALGA